MPGRWIVGTAGIVMLAALASALMALGGVAMGIIPFFTRLAGRAQSGYLFHYAFAMVLGIVALVTWMTVFGGAK